MESKVKYRIIHALCWIASASVMIGAALLIVL